MKNVFFSVLVLFMLAVSMLGNVNLVKADPIQNLSISQATITPQKIIKDVQETVTVLFVLSNTAANDMTLDITTNRPRTTDTQHFLTVENANVGANYPYTIENDYSLPANEPRTIDFTVTLPQNEEGTGTYTGTITVTDQDGDTLTRDYSIVVENSNPAVSVSGLTDNQIVITSEEENVKTKEFTLANSGNRNLNDLTLKIEGGTFSDDTETISFRAKFGDDVFRNVVLNTPLEMASDLNTGSSSTITIEATIPQDINLDNYIGRIVIADTAHAQATVTIPLTIKIEPEICSDGRISNGISGSVDGPQSGNLRISISNPDRNDDFKINDEISIEVEVENKENKDLDVIAEAVLYDLDRNKKILPVSSDSLEVEKDSREDFDFTMIVPNDEDIDPGNTYILYIKAYEDGDEDQYCNYDSVEIDLERDDDAVVINSFTINPTVALQESSISFRVGVENIGTDEQRDAYIVLRNEELNLNLRSNVFDLKKYDKSGNDYIFTQTFTVPKDVDAKDYTIEAVVYYNNERDTASKSGTLTVQAKESGEEEAITPTAATGPVTYTPTGASIFDGLDSTKTLFIIGDIVLVILAVLFLILIFKKK